MATFDPSRSRVNESQLSDFINSEISGDLKEVTQLDVLNFSKFMIKYSFFKRFLELEM